VSSSTAAPLRRGSATPRCPASPDPSCRCRATRPEVLISRPKRDGNTRKCFAYLALRGRPDRRSGKGYRFLAADPFRNLPNVAACCNIRQAVRCNCNYHHKQLQHANCVGPVIKSNAFSALREEESATLAGTYKPMYLHREVRRLQPGNKSRFVSHRSRRRENPGAVSQATARPEARRSGVGTCGLSPVAPGLEMWELEIGFG
jgi:hypothetical protein